MNIANRKFLFDFTESNFILPEYFKDNEDFKINFQKALQSQREIIVNCKLNLCKDDFILFYDYIYIDLERTKNAFKADLNIQGVFAEVTCDIISYPIVSAKNNNYEITFDVAII